MSEFKSVDELKEAVGKSSKMTEASLTKCSLIDADCFALAPFLANNKTLTSLDLSGNKIGNDGCLSLAKALGKLTNVKKRENTMSKLWKNGQTNPSIPLSGRILCQRSQEYDVGENCAVAECYS